MWWDLMPMEENMRQCAKRQVSEGMTLWVRMAKARHLVHP